MHFILESATMENHGGGAEPPASQRGDSLLERRRQGQQRIGRHQIAIGQARD